MSDNKKKGGKCSSVRASDGSFRPLGQRGQDYPALRKVWYDRLRAEGFRDIEYSPEPNGLQLDYLRGSLSTGKRARARRTPELVSAAFEYYRLAEALLNSDYRFGKGEKPIWRLHAEGRSVRYIARTLKVSSRDICAICKRLRAMVHGEARYAQGEGKRPRRKRKHKKTGTLE